MNKKAICLMNACVAGLNIAFVLLGGNTLNLYFALANVIVVILMVGSASNE